MEGKDKKNLLATIAGCGAFAMIVVLGFLAWSWPSLVGGQPSIRRWYLIQNMKMTAIAVDCYVRDRREGPSDMKSLQSYFPVGLGPPKKPKEADVKIAPGQPPVNPYTLKAEWPILIAAESSNKVQVDSESKSLKAGEILLVGLKSAPSNESVAQTTLSDRRAIIDRIVEHSILHLEPCCATKANYSSTRS
ncbi:MAG: hypothetical protein K2W95_01365 [Candidatus Obscuribacterales bacterium]|nr:hypothetical protein [Candidatus Obscuribacterales bacterium]